MYSHKCSQTQLHMQPYAAVCSHMQPYAAICSHMQPYAAICSYTQPYAAIVLMFGLYTEHCTLQLCTIISGHIYGHAHKHKNLRKIFYSQICSHIRSHIWSQIYSQIWEGGCLWEGGWLERLPCLMQISTFNHITSNLFCTYKSCGIDTPKLKFPSENCKFG